MATAKRKVYFFVNGTFNEVWKFSKMFINDCRPRSWIWQVLDFVSITVWKVLFWSVFSHFWTESGRILRISPYSVRMRENKDQNNSAYGHILRSESDHFFPLILNEFCGQPKWSGRSLNSLNPLLTYSNVSDAGYYYQWRKQALTDQCCPRRLWFASRIGWIWGDYKSLLDNYSHSCSTHSNAKYIIDVAMKL